MYNVTPWVFVNSLRCRRTTLIIIWNLYRAEFQFHSEFHRRACLRLWESSGGVCTVSVCREERFGLLLQALICGWSLMADCGTAGAAAWFTAGGMFTFALALSSCLIPRAQHLMFWLYQYIYSFGGVFFFDWLIILCFFCNMFIIFKS